MWRLIRFVWQTSLLPSASDRHLQRDWVCAGRWSECRRAERWHLCDQAGKLGVLPVQPAEQAPADHAHHQPAREHRPVSRVLTGCHWQVTKHECGSLDGGLCFRVHHLAPWRPRCRLVRDALVSSVSLFVSVSQTAAWLCSPWRRRWPRCVEGNLSTSSAVSTGRHDWHDITHSRRNRHEPTGVPIQLQV